MEQVLERIIDRYGTGVIWTHEGKRKVVRGFFQPVTSRSWQKLLRQETPLGDAPTGLYVFLGAVSDGLVAGDEIQVEQRHYRIRRTEYIFDSEGPVYLWALCVQRGE